MRKKTAEVAESIPSPIDTVNHPPHYTQGRIECIDAIESMLGRFGFIAFLRGQIIKYTWRSLDKGDPVENIQKLEWYRNRLQAALLGDGEQ